MYHVPASKHHQLNCVLFNDTEKEEWKINRLYTRSVDKEDYESSAYFQMLSFLFNVLSYVGRMRMCAHACAMGCSADNGAFPITLCLIHHGRVPRLNPEFTNTTSLVSSLFPGPLPVPFEHWDYMPQRPTSIYVDSGDGNSGFYAC